MRWYVETPSGPEDVGADCFLIRDGALLLYSDPECAPRHLVIGYAAGQWFTVIVEDGE